MRTTKNGLRGLMLRSMALLLLLLGASLPARAADYVFIYDGGYLAVDNSDNVIYTTTFSPQCVWTCVSNTGTLAAATLGNTSRFLYATDGNGTRRWLVGSTTDGAAITTTTTAPGTAYWRNNDNRLNYYSSYNRYAYYRDNTWRVSRRNNGNSYGVNAYRSGNNSGTDYRSTTYTCTTTSQGPTDNTTLPIVSITGNTNNTITFSHTDLGGSYVPQYTRYVISTSPSSTHNWYNNTDYGSDEPSITLNPTYSWSVTSSSDDAEINSEGVLTIKRNPTANIVVRLTVSNISPIANKTVDFTLTRTHYNENVSTVTTMSAVTLTPTSKTMEYGDDQEFTASATVDATTSTTQAYDRLQNGDNTYYYYGGALHNSTPTPEEEVTHPDPTYSWTLSNHNSKLTPTSGSGATITITHSTQATADVNATLTVTASASGESKTATATIKAYAPVAEPTITQTGTNISIATTSSDATIYYTTDKTTPSAENGTAYSGPFPLTSSPTTVKAVTIRNGNSSTVASQTFTLKLPTPVITITQNTGSTTIAAGQDSPAGTKIYYTTDGTTPSASSTQYSTAFTVTSGQTVKAIAILTGYTNSDVTSQIYVTSGVSGGTVTLNDLEDHTWTYYAGVDASVDGGNYNTSYAGKLYSPNPRNVKITYNGVNGVANSSTTVKVSRDESETSFVYYKTLEEGTTSGEYPYQVISNPFSVRPSTGSGNSKVYYGFAGWKIVSGGEYIKNHSNDDVLTLDEEIVFENLPYPSVNCISAEIEFETSWTTANVRTGNNITTMLGNFSGGTYETNFAVMTGAYTTAWTGNKNVTVTSVYPDGSSDVRSNTNYTRLNVTVNSGYTVKYEYININNDNSTLSMGSGTKTLYIGRGVSNTTTNGVVCNLIQGYGDAISSGGLTYTLKIESGIYNYLSYIKGYEGAQTNDRVSGTISVKGVLGCDYDRAIGDNSKLKIQNQIMMGYANSGRVLLRNATAGQEVLNVTLKSGSLHSSLNSAGTADAAQSFYIGIGGEYSAGYRVFTMEGGEMWSLAAGICNNTQTTNSIRFRIKGGLIKGSIYGSAANANSYGYKQMILTGGQVKGWIAGGGNGTSANGGTTTGSSYLYVGGNCRVDSEGSDTKINSSIGGQVFGSGSGVDGSTTWGEMLYGSNVVIADNAYVERNVFGGGNFGWTDEYATIYLTGDKMSVGKVFGGANQNKGDNVRIYMTGGTVREGLYGGSNTTGTINYNVEMHIDGGQVGTPSQHANIHGGGYGQPTRVSRNVEITLGTDCNATSGVTVYGDVYGGSALGYVNGTTATTDYHTYVTLNKGTIHGSLYGGGLGAAGTAANVYGPVQVKVFGGSVLKTDANGANGSGAVYGCNNIYGAPQRSVSVDIYGTDPAPSANDYALFAVYGGGNQADYAYGTPTVKVHNCNNSIEYVYGGGNAAHITNGNTDVTIYGGNKIGNVFGGGNGTVTAANVSGNTNVKIYGGTILRVFGGSNSAGSIGSTISVTAESQTESGTNPCTETAYERCPIQVGELYGGGNLANSNVGSVSIGCMEDGDMIDYVYGGANQADVTGNISLEMTGGRVGNLFGGNNTSGAVKGNIQVTVNWNGSCDEDSYLGNVFGGGNLAQYSIYGYNNDGTVKTSGNAVYDNPVVQVLNGTVTHNVYGGGKGKSDDHTKGLVIGAPQVTIGDATPANSSYQATVSGSVFGGGDAGNVSGTPVVNVAEKCNTTISTAVYGGGNAADVTGTNVTINGGTIGDVFGGGNGAVAAANVTGATSLTIHGGTISRVFAGGNTSGTIGTNSGVTIDHTSSCAQTITEVYGGGNLADGNAGTVNISCSAENIGDVYGGANQADVANDITLNITGGQINNVFGGNNTSGSISGGITVNINKATDCNTFSVNNVYGGGNLAQYTIPNNKALAVNILNGTVSGNVYGGGKGLAANHSKGQVTGNPIVNIGDNDGNHTATVTGDVYGGGDAGDVVGTPQVNVYNKCSTTIGNVYGGGNAADVSGTDVNIDGGVITGDVFGGGHGDKASLNNALETGHTDKVANVNGNTSVTVTGGTIHRVFAGSNINGTISGTNNELVINKSASAACDMKIGEVYGGGNMANGNATAITIGCTGTLVPGNSGHAAHPENIGTTLEGIGYVYGGANQANIGASGAGNESDITVTINSGIVANVFGGNNTSGTIYGDIEVNIEKTSESNTCGWYVGNVFGGGNLAAYTGDPEVNIKNGTVSIAVYGGGKGPSAVVTGDPVVTIGDNTSNTTYAIVSGNVYGGGDAAAVTGTTNVIYNDNNASSQVYKLFGGGNEAGVSSTATVTMTNGKVTGGIYGGCNSSGTVTGDITVYINGGTLGVLGTPMESGIFGGGYGQFTETEGNVTVNVGDANAASAGVCPVIYGDIYGGSALGSVNDAVGDFTTVNFNNGTLHGNLYGGGLGAATLNGYGYIESVSTEAIVNGTVHVNIGTSEQLSNFVTIDGKVFGCNNLAGTPKGHVYVDVYRTAHSGSNTYPSPEPASAADIPTPTTANFAIAEVYGGGNLAHYTTNTENASTHVHIHNCDNTIQYVYGGGNAANTVANEVTIDGGRMEYIFGGGNGKGSGNPGANVEGNATVKLGGGVINYVFGGSNTLGVVNGTASVDFLSVTCSRKVYELYGGGNEAPGGTVNMTIPCGATGLNVVYGGSKNADIGTQELFEAETKKNITLNIEGGILSKVFGGNNQGGDVWGDVILNLKGGTIVDAFGGNNQGGNIKGSITVNVDEDETLDCPLVLTNVFGGGKDAAYTPASASILYPQVNIKHKKSGTSITGSVYGGGQGSGAVVTANPVVTIGDNNANHLATIAGNVYGGGDAAAVTGNTTVTYNDNNASSQVANLFGGGNAASVSGTTTVTMTSGKVTAGVYGGCNSSGSVGAVTVALNGGQVGTDALHADVYGGGYGASTGTTGNIGVTLNGTTVYGDLYGGSALGSVNANTSNTTTVTLTSATLHGSVFGGGKGDGGTTATSEGQAIVNINVYDQYLTGIYGGANVRGLVKGDIAVNVNANVGASGDGNSLNIFGGGYGAATNTNGNVTVTIGNETGTIVPTIYGDIYGGSALGNVNDAAADVTTVNFLNGTLHGNLYGGGLGDGSNAAKVNGQVVVNISNTTQTEGNCHIDLREATIYGCNNTNGSPQDNVTVNIYKTAHTTTNAATYTENDGVNGVPTYAIDQVFGGGNQADYDPTSNDSRATVHVYGCNNTIRRVFGGGNAAAAYGVVTTIDGGRFDYIFGGGNGEVTAANIGAGGTNLIINSGIIDYLFGGSNQNGTIAGPMGVVINNTGCTEQIKNFFAGGNLAVIGTPESPATLSTTIACGTVFDAVYGGSNLADIYGDVTLTINGGTIGEVFAGSKGRSATSDPGNSTPKAANIYGDVTLNIYGGTIGNAFGGSNINGNITGTATVNLDWSQSDCPGKSINYIYGASNLATYTPSPKPEYSPMVNLINGTVNYSVFGAGKGADDVQAAGKVTSNPKVNMSGASAWVKKNVYGGGEMATVDGNTYVNISNGIVGPADLDPTDIDGHGDVFGGGLGKAGAEYSTFAFVTNANVTLSGGTVRGSVFGGGENGHVSNNTSVTVSGGVVGVRIPYAYRNISSDAGSSNPVYAGNVYGGGRGVDHTAVGNHLSETAGRVYGNTSVSVTGGQIHHSVYGGGSLASVGTYTLTPANNIYGGHLHNFTNGTGNATVSISGGRIGPTWDELLLDDAGNSLVDANGDALNAAAATTIAHNYECLGENEGMVYGSGRGVNYTNDGNEDHQLYVEMAFTNNTTVTISGTADVVGSVFGGGENGHVKGNTQVNIQGGTIGGIPLHHKGIDLPGHSEGHGHIDDDDDNDDELGYNETGIGRSVFRGNVYGGGRGIDHTAGDATTTDAHIFSVSAGRVYGNTEVNVTGGRIYHNVFGGGSIASVGTYSYPSDGAGGYDFFTDPEAATSNTGKTTVNISGGQIGVMGENEGYVYGGGRGIAGTNETQVSHLAFVNETEVNISQTNSTHADVRASVFGGGMNGHVLTNTEVNVSGGVIGGKTAANYGSGAESYDPDVFTAVPSKVDYTINGINYYSGIRPGDTITTPEGLGPATVFLGNVYGGGRGVDVTTGANLSYTAGRVYGNTAVNITGGVIYHSVFGGGSIASVGTYTTYTTEEAAADAGQSERYDLVANQPKTCTSGGDAVVTITGGRIGTNGRNNGRVFGSSRGMAGTSYRGLGYVNRAHVVIGTTSGNTSTPEIRGSVFGSGENGHVLDSTLVEVKSGHIGNGIRTDYLYLNKYIGNVYGGGRGLDRSDPLSANSVSPFAGRVYRNTYVSVTGGQIDNNVYGGGSLASVGRYKRNNNNEITFADADKGTARVNISGGTIGIDGDENGHVFGASRGTSVAYRERNNDSRARLAYVADSRVIVSGGTIKGSVFGGGESGHVQRDARVTISGGEIGSTIPSDYNDMNAANKRKYDLMGNVYGAGRGIDEAHSGDNAGYSMSAGYVRGRTIVTITNTNTPIIHRNVYGGGSMGTVGDYGPYCRLDFWQGTPANFARGTEANNYTDASNGVATVVIKGTVGTSTDVARNYGGNVYGSCRGQANDPTHDSELDLFYTEDGGFGEMAYVTGSHVIVETGANVWGNVYGGGENGHVDFGGTLVNILNGHVHGNVFGGGKGTSTSPTAGIVDGDATVNIGLPSQDANTPDANGSYNTVEIDGNVFGGNDSYSSPIGTMTVNVYHTKHTAANKYPTLSNPVQASDTAGNNVESKYALKGVYGGGNLADVLTGIAAVDASDDNASHVYDQRYITQRISATNSNPSGYYPWPGGISRKSVVNIYNCEENTIMYVYGGGRSAYTIEDEVNIYGGRIYQAYAGGDGRADPAYVGYLDGANLRTVPANNNHGKAVINIFGGIVNQVFGGCNTQGEVNGTSTVNFAQGPDCDILNSEVFGGNNQADMTRDKEVTIQCGSKWNDVYGGSNEADLVGNIILNIVGGSMNRAFGGSKNADIDGNVTVNVYGGHIGELFGGNNAGGNITGTITVNVDIDPDYNCPDGLALTTVYGGGKDAAYEPFDCFRFSPMVNIKNTSTLQISEVFGGGYGATAQTVSYPRVIVGGFGDGKSARVYNNVYGGGYGAPVYGNTIAMVRSSVIGNDAGTAGTVFGGGFGTTAVIHGETYVGIFGLSDIKQNVYGGGNAGAVLGSTDVQVAYEELLLPPETRGEMDAGTVYATLVSGTDGATIRYTLDGTEPTTTTGTVYNGTRFPIDFADNIQAIAYKDGMIPSVVSFNQAPTPTITIDGASATLDGYLGSKLYYTTDGTEPTTSSNLYGGAAVDETGYNPAATISVTANSVIKVLAVMRGCANSHVAYLQAPQPEISSDGANYTITAPAGARIIYTTFTSTPTGSNPTSAMGGGTEHGIKVSEANDDDDDDTSVKKTITLTDGETLKAIVELDGYMPSIISAVKYTAAP